MRSRVRDFLGSAPIKLVAVVLFAILLPSVLVTALGLVAVFQAQSFVEEFRRSETEARVNSLVAGVNERWERRIEFYRRVLSSFPREAAQLEELKQRDPYVREIVWGGASDAPAPPVPRRLAPEGRPLVLRALEKLEFEDGDLTTALREAEHLYLSTADEGVRVEALFAVARLRFKSNARRAACASLEEAYDRYGDTIDVSGTLRGPAILARLVDVYGELDNDSRRRNAARRLRQSLRQNSTYLSAGAQERYAAKVAFLPETAETAEGQVGLARDSRLPPARRLRRMPARMFVQTILRDGGEVEVLSLPVPVRDSDVAVHVVLSRAALRTEAEWAATQLGLATEGLTIAKASRARRGDGEAMEFRYGLASPFDHLELRYQPPSIHLPPPFRAFDLMSLATFTWSVVVLVLAIIVGVAVTLRTVLRERRTARLKTDFVSFISHELKTPLTSIRMYAETLLDERITDDGEKELCIRMVDRESKRLASLIDQILQYSQFERHQKEFLFSSCNMEDAVRDAVRLFKEHDQSGRLVEINSVQRISKIRMDRAAIIELLLNFIGNAAKYSPVSEPIMINLRESIEDICVDVVDNGVGIRKRDQKKIFDKFYRAEDYLTRDVEGTGLGLTFARYIAKVHNGEIKVNSQLNGGSTFTLQLRKTHVLAE